MPRVYLWQGESAPADVDGPPDYARDELFAHVNPDECFDRDEGFTESR